MSIDLLFFKIIQSLIYSQTVQPRANYREFLEVAYIFLGETPPGGIHFKTPGTSHLTRFMARVIHSLKIFLFQKQFKLTRNAEKFIRTTCIFIIKFYIKTWFTAPLSVKAPNSDLKLG